MSVDREHNDDRLTQRVIIECNPNGAYSMRSENTDHAGVSLLLRFGEKSLMETCFKKPINSTQIAIPATGLHLPN